MSRAAARTAAMDSGSSTSSAITTPTDAAGKPRPRRRARWRGTRPWPGRPRRPARRAAAPRRPACRGRAAGRRGRRRRRRAARAAGATGRKKSRCRTVWVKTNSRRAPARQTAAKASCAPENSGPGVGGREPRQHQRDAGQRDDGREGRAGALGVEVRQVVPQRPDQQRQPDDAVGGDHHRREDGVPRQRRGVLAAA